jgi:dTDP-glucose pyrophosphorylase
VVSVIDIPLSTAATLFDAVRAIEASQRRIAVVVDETGRLIGTLTDGDVRRCLLVGGTLKTSAVDAMNPQPLIAVQGCSDAHLLELMRVGNVMCIPIVDSAGVFKTLVHLTDLGTNDGGTSDSNIGFAAAVIMAGGEGARLRPLTESIPKPMVEIGGVPLLERHIRRLSHAGIETAYISVNYLSHVIEHHFGNGERFGIRIEYLREKTKLGTAGALSLLPASSAPFLMMNGDIVARPDFASLYAYHTSHGAALTVAAVDYRVNIPYGVIRAEGPYLAVLEEKPSQRFLCNAGIYAVDPAALRLIPESAFYNMTDLIADCLARGYKVAVYPMHEYWSDIGTADDLEKTRAAFAEMVEHYD